MNILLISFTFSPIIGGLESHLEDLCNSLIRKGHNIVVITSKPTSDSELPLVEKQYNLEIHRIPWITFNLAMFSRFERIPILQVCYLVPSVLVYSIWYLLRAKNHIDVLQAHGFNMGIVAAVLAYLTKIPFTINTHATFRFQKQGLYSFILKKIINQSRRTLVLTEEARDELINIGIKRSKLIIYHYWIDPIYTPKNKKKSRQKLKLPKYSFIILFVGRFIRVKGIDVLLNVAMHLPKNFIFLFAGSGPMLSEVLKVERDYSNIRYAGQLTRRDLPYYYSASDICIIPSETGEKTYTEGIPRVMIESLSCGTPVVITKTGGAKELMNSKVGFFVEPKVKDIKLIIQKLSLQREKLERMRKDCTEYAKEQFDLRKNASIIENSL